MKRFKILALIGLITIIGTCNFALAANTANQTVTFQVDAISEFTTSGNPAALIVNTAVAGSEPSAAIDSTTTYAITTNQLNKKITGVLDSAMPANTKLEINLAAPTGATSLGNVALSDVATDLVTGISRLAESGKTITYTFSATIAAGVIASSTRTVTLTVTD